MKSGKKSKRRYITRGEAVDHPDYEEPFSPTPSYAVAPTIDAPITRAHTVDNPVTLTSSPMSSRSRPEVRHAADLPRSRTFDQPQKDYREARDRLTQLEPRPHSFRASRRDSTGSEASARHEQSPLRTDSSASNASASTGTLVEKFPGRARWHQEDATRSPALNTRTMSSESEMFGSVARKGVSRDHRNDDVPTSSASMPHIPTSPIIAHGPTRARRFVGRPSSRETATIDDGFLSSPSRPRASAGWQNTLSNIEDQELTRPQSDIALVSQSSTESKPDDSLSKAERIAQYKEKRRKELASMFGGVQKAASFDTADIRGDGTSYLKYRRSSSREDNRTPQDKIPPPVATVSPMVTGIYSTTQSQVQSPSQYPMVTVMSPSSPLKVTADVGTSTSSVGTQTPSPTGVSSSKAQTKNSAQPEEQNTPPTTRRLRRDRSPLKSIQGAVNLPTIKDEPSPEIRANRQRRLLRPDDVSEKPRERSRVLSPSSESTGPYDRTRVLSPNSGDATVSYERPDRLPERSRLFSPTTSDSALSQCTTRTLTPVGNDGAVPKDRSRLAPEGGNERIVSPPESDASVAVSSERSRLLSPSVSSSTRPSAVTLEPLSSLLPPRNVSRPSSTTPLQSQMLDIPQQPPRPASATSKPETRHIIRPQPIRATTVQRSESSPSKMLHMRPSSRSERNDSKSSAPRSSSLAALSSPKSFATTTPASSSSIATSAIPVDSQSTESHKSKQTSHAHSLATSAYSSNPSNPSGLAISSHLSSLLSSTNTTSAIPYAKMSAKPQAETIDSKFDSKSAAPLKSSKPTKAQLDDSKQTVHVLESHKPVTAKTKQSKEYRPLNQPEQVKQQNTSQQEDELQAIESAKPKLRPLFTREDSFNRPDSPPRQPIPLPKNSVIARNRSRKLSSSSSSEITPTPSPITSPRMSRRRGQRQETDALLSPPPRRHRQGKSRTRAAKKSPGRPLKEGQETSKDPSGTGRRSPINRSPAPKGSPRSKSPSKHRKNKPETKDGKEQKEAAKDSKMGQGHSAATSSGGHGHLQGQGHLHGPVIDRSATLPAPVAYSQGHQKTPAKPLQTQISQVSQSSQQSEDVPPQRHIERRMSDSSSATSASRRRYRQRDSSLDSTQLDPVTLRPGKKDKSSTRKSSLNSSELNSQDNGNRVRECTPISSDDGGENKRLSRYDQIQSSRAKSGVAELSLSPPPVPSEEPFPVTQEFVSEKLGKSPSPITVQQYPPVRTQSSTDRPRSAISPPPQSGRTVAESQVRSPDVVTVHGRDVISPRRMVSPETVSYDRPFSTHEQSSLLGQGGTKIRPKSQQDYRPHQSVEQRPLSQQVQARDPRSGPHRVQSQTYQNVDVIQAYSPVIGKTATGPLSPVRSQAPESPWSSQGPLSPTQRQGGPLSPTPHTQTDRTHMVRSPVPPLQVTPSTMHDRSALSPVGRQGPLSPTTHGPLSPNRQPMSPPPLMSPTQMMSPGVNSQVIQPPIRNRALSPISPVRGYAEPVQHGPLPRSMSSDTGPRNPVPAPVVFPSPRPLSPPSNTPNKPKFVPYTKKDLEDAYQTSQEVEKSKRLSQIQPTPPTQRQSGTYEIILPSNTQQSQSTQQQTIPKTQAPTQTSVAPPPTSVVPQKSATSHQTSVAPKQTSVAPKQTSVAPKQTSVAPKQTSVAPKQTSVVPPKRTEPQKTVATPQQTSVAPHQTTTVASAPSKDVPSEAKSEQRSSDNDAQEVEETINKLHRERSTESPAREDVLPNLRRGSRDVSELVRRFSSDVSDKEGSPAGNRGDGAALLRRTPDRTQSFRQQKTPPPESFIRAKSFREKKNGQPEKAADEQLQEILKRRSKTIDEWEEKVASQAPDLEKVTEVEAQKFEARFKNTHSPSPVPIDSELSSALQVRREREERESGGSQRSSESESNIKSSKPQTEKVTIKSKKATLKPRKLSDTPKVEPIKTTSTEVEIKIVETKLHVTSPASSETTSTTTSEKTSTETTSTTTSDKTSTETTSATTSDKTSTTTQSSEGVISEQDTDSSPKVDSDITPDPVTVKEKSAPVSVQKKDVKPKEKPVSQPIKKMTNETTASIITVAPVVRSVPKDAAKTNAEVAPQPPATQDKVSERVSTTQSLKLRPAMPMNDVTNLQRSSRKIELTRSESFQDQGQVRPPLRKTQTVDLGGLEGERAACNLAQPVAPTRRRSVHSPTPETELQGTEKESKRVSVAERIFQMETKVDDVYTPRSGTSGAMTPRVIKLRTSAGPSGTASPRRGQEVAPMTLTSTPEDIVSDQLMARLGDMAVLQEAAIRRQQGPQKSHQDPRRRTQPVTLVEVQEASALDSVVSFRAEVSKNTLINEFKKSKTAQRVYKSKGQETFPQPFHRESLKNRRKDKRYQTQPITTEELGEIPELRPLTLPERPPKRTLFNLDLTSDSDVELDHLVQVNYSKLTGQKQVAEGQNGRQNQSDKSDTTDKDSTEAQDEFSKLSVLQKMSLFRKMEDPKQPDMTPRTKRRFLDRKKRLERSRTQPITEEELTQASEFAAAENGNKQENGEQENQEQNEETTQEKTQVQAAVSSDNVAKMDLAEDATIDELSRMSLAEKMKLFSENKSSEETKRDAPVLRRKARRAQSRFKTQPITIEEVEKAKISPLAVTMIKPPDPELLQNMTVKDQRTFLAEYARANFKTIKQSSTEEAPPSLRDQKKTVTEETVTLSTVTSSTVSASTVETSTVAATSSTVSASTVETSTVAEPVTSAHTVVSSQATSAPSSGTESKSLDKPGSKKEELRKQRQKQLEQKLQDSSTEDETFDKIQRIKNEAIARRRRMMEMRKAGESRYHSQPIDPSQIPRKENGDITKEEKTTVHVRHKTQPVTDSEKASVTAAVASQPGVRGSIHDRLAKLKQHGEEDWKKRVRGKEIPNVDLSSVKLRDKSKLKSQQIIDQRPKSIADRMSKLETAQATWKDRVEEKDVTQFTVEGKLNRAGKTTTPDSPIVARRKKMRAPLTREEDEDQEKDENKTPGRRPGRPPPYPSTPTSSKIHGMAAELQSALAFGPRRPHSSPLPLPVDSSEAASSEMEEKMPTKIEVPEPYDEEFQLFFGTQDVTAAEPIDVTVDDFDHIFMESEDMLPSTRKIRPQRKQRTTKNPLKSLAARDDVHSEYTEVRTDIADKELRRIKREQIAGTAGFAEEALAGLASKENFSRVNLRKTDSFGSSTPAGMSGKYEPFKDIMLLHVKGRRHCQVRLVEPIADSLNSGDSFVLVTSNRVYIWIGEYCNIIEKSKATDVAATVQQKRDLGCKSYQEPIVIYEKRQDSPGSKGFWEALGGKEEYQGPGPTEEDELYEMYMTETNRVWMIDPGAEKLVELDEYQGTVLPHALLNTKAALVFDFGGEFYIWTGKQVPFVTRKLALKLAREQFDKGYDYSKFDINPFSPLSTPEKGGLPLQSDARPDWALFGKVNENMETILFREKFVDWPDSSRLIKVKTDSDDQKSEPPPELEPYDAGKMIAVKNIPVDLLLDGSHIGRGQKWVDKTEGITREFEILTLSIQVWHILEYDHSEVAEDSYGQFHDGDTYVVRWHYMVSQAGRTLKGQEARHSMTGRERCAYFFWQGRNSSINEKGASALMTVELDEERGPQVRVIQGKEPPYFIQLFKDRMITHIGKREDETTNSQGTYRMYLVRNELPKEAYLAEVTCNISNLRSRGIFLLVNVKTGICYLWIGCKSSTLTRDRSRELANNLVNKCPLEVGLHPKASVTITEVEEGKENSEFWSALDSSHRSLYFSLLNVSKPCQFTMRLFTMTSVSGIFEATELLNPCRSEDIASSFPFIQSDLYKLSQPSLVMVDAGPEVWVWHGWWPEETEDSDNIKTGSAVSRFNTERKLALRTTIAYCKEKFGSSGAKDRAYATYAGLEPLGFTNLFPHWSTRNDVTDIQLQEGRHVGERRKVDDLLVQLNRNNYAWLELQQLPLPEGVDPLRLESYLIDDEFLEMLGMPKEDFYNLPTWKQGNLKKTVGLF